MEDLYFKKVKIEKGPTLTVQISILKWNGHFLILVSSFLCVFGKLIKVSKMPDPRLSKVYALMIPLMVTIFQHPRVNRTESSVRMLSASPVKYGQQ